MNDPDDFNGIGYFGPPDKEESGLAGFWLVMASGVLILVIAALSWLISLF